MVKSLGGVDTDSGQVTSAVLKGGQSQLRLLLPSYYHVPQTCLNREPSPLRERKENEKNLPVQEVFCEAKLKRKCVGLLILPNIDLSAIIWLSWLPPTLLYRPFTSSLSTAFHHL